MFITSMERCELWRGSLHATGASWPRRALAVENNPDIRSVVYSSYMTETSETSVLLAARGQTGSRQDWYHCLW